MKPKLSGERDLRYFEAAFTEIPVGSASDFESGAGSAGGGLGAARQSVS